MASVPDVLTRAIQLAQARYTDDDWYQLSPGTRTTAIYQELARLDAESVKAAAPTAWERRKRSRRAEDRHGVDRRAAAAG